MEERGREIKSEREKEMREEPSFSSVPPSTIENVSAENQRRCEEAVASTAGLHYSTAEPGRARSAKCRHN